MDLPAEVWARVASCVGEKEDSFRARVALFYTQKRSTAGQLSYVWKLTYTHPEAGLHPEAVLHRKLIYTLAREQSYT
jgi:hypothetical protein